jgi:hypothetical protein
MTDNVPLPVGAAFYLSSRKGVVSSDDQTKGTLERRVALRCVFAIGFRKMGEPDIQK